MRREEAETLALRGLSWLAGEPDALLRFLDSSGLTPGDLRERANDPDLLAAVVDFLLGDDPLLSAFCEAEGIKSETVHLARRTLPGGIETN